ncbi:RNA pseudouridine synthase [Treponema sp.]
MNKLIDRARILHKDEHCVVVNKAIGEAMEGVSAGMVDLAALLGQSLGLSKTADGKDFAPTAVHRIDVPVTGCSLFARTPEALAFLNTVFAEGKARKTYWAVVEMPSDKEKIPVLGRIIELKQWISVDGRTNKSYVSEEAGKEKKEAILRYQLIGQGDRYLFLEVELITGRHHQIRAQLAAVGLIIKGDLKYGAKRSEKGGGIRLHARSLAFPDLSRKGAFIQCSAPLPAGDALWQAFEAAAKPS